MNILKPCPFCGGEADFEDTKACCTDATWTVVCTQCGSRLGIESLDKNDVAEDWNRRVVDEVD